MNAALQAVALQWQARALPAIVVEVVDARGSVPREAGTRMLVGARDAHGTIGGGHLELQAIEHARALLRGEPLRREQRIALGPTLGQCCGGALTLRYRTLAESAPAAWPAAPPRFTLQLYGAGHVGRAIVRLLADIDCRVQWIDEREHEFAGAASAPHIERVCVEPVDAEVALAPAGAFYLVLTHDHALDMAITEAILRRGDFGFLGLIGSRTKRARFVHRFEARGIAADTLARLTCPIGVPGIAGKEPAVIALAAVAQLLQCASKASRQAMRATVCAG
ncbi:MAG: xanthine dehydrogenase accessory protein XdhC [Ideonella sp.]|nr:xanthine dehydrogenase accessory protein XdhC [Ideonella sp.]MCC7455710.1 xanthine dehydrogenase accessory protein XdhC [Nitrospira sp.]